MLLLVTTLVFASTPRLPRPTSDLPRARTRPVPAQQATPTPDRFHSPLGAADDETLMSITQRVRLDDLEVRSRVMPDFPSVAGDVRAHDCEMRLFIDASGAPLRALPLQCDASFADASEDALLRWRFAPYEVDGNAVPVRTDVVVEFRR